MAPEEIAKKDPEHKRDKKKALDGTRNKMLASVFMDGANEKCCGVLM